MCGGCDYRFFVGAERAAAFIGALVVFLTECPAADAVVVAAARLA